MPFSPYFGALGTPTYIPQNDPFVALIICVTLITYVRFLKKELPHGGSGPSSQTWGEEGEVRNEISCFAIIF